MLVSRFVLFLQDKGPWLAEMANWQVNATRNTARSVLQLKVGAVRVEIHRQEAPTSVYPGKLLAAMSRDDLMEEQAR